MVLKTDFEETGMITGGRYYGKIRAEILNTAGKLVMAMEGDERIIELKNAMEEHQALYDKANS